MKRYTVKCVDCGHVQTIIDDGCNQCPRCGCEYAVYRGHNVVLRWRYPA